MKNPEDFYEPRFYFALPRLVASQLGWNAARTERNWLEANLVGGLENLIWYAFAIHKFLHGLPLWEKIALLLPLAFVVWVFWLLVLYLNSVFIRVLLVFGLFGNLPSARIQSVLLGIVTTVFAFYLSVNALWLGLLGIAWVAAVSLNLLAAAVLVVTDAVNPATE